MLMTRTWCAVAIGALGFALPVACMHLEDPAPPTQSQLVVHAVLNQNAEAQIILIHQARTGALSRIGGDIAGISDDEPVSGAVVIVTSPNGSVMTAIENTRDSAFAFHPGEYVLVPSRFGVLLAQGATYSLHVRTPSGQNVSGTTTIPRASFGS